MVILPLRTFISPGKVEESPQALASKTNALTLTTPTMRA